MFSIYRNRLFLAVAAGHFAVDILNSIGPVLMAVLAPILILSNGQIGMAITLYTLAGALSQPICGWLADHFPGRPPLLAGLGVIWMAVFFGLVAFAHSWEFLLPVFVLAALGSGMFHPIGTASASGISHARAGRSTAIFFFSGQVGLAIGPALGGLLLGMSGNLGILPLCLFVLVPAGLLLVAPALPPVHHHAKQAAGSTAHAAAFALVAFVILVAVRSSIQNTYTAFLPKLFSDRGWDPVAYGIMAGAFMFAAAIGNFVAGELADRYGIRAATVWALLFSTPAGLVCLWAPNPITAFIACAIAGLFIGGQHSVLVIHAQRLLPTKQGFAAGLILGFTFASGGIGTWLGGIAADQIGLYPVMQIFTLLCLPAALLALTLPGRESVIQTPVSAETA